MSSRGNQDYYDAFATESNGKPLDISPYRRTVLVGMVFFLFAMMLPSHIRLFGLRLTDLCAAIGAAAFIVPPFLIAVYQSRTLKHFNKLLHLHIPALGLVMLLIRIIMSFFTLPAALTNIWGILATFLLFPLFQQLMNIASGSVDMDDGGNQVIFNNDR